MCMGGMAKGADATMRAICDGVGEKGEHGRGDGAGGVHGPLGGGDYSRRDEDGAKTSGEEA